MSMIRISFPREDVGRMLPRPRRGVSNTVGAGLLVAGIVIGVLGFYVASTYQTKVVTTTETTTATTVSLTTSTEELTSTQVSVLETTSTSYITSIFTTSIFPIPDNVTVYFVPSSLLINYAINAGTYNAYGSLGNPQSFTVSPVYQGETIVINIGSGCGGSTGPTGNASLYVNGSLVAHSSIACGGNNNAQISYVL